MQLVDLTNYSPSTRLLLLSSSRVCIRLRIPSTHRQCHCLSFCKRTRNYVHSCVDYDDYEKTIVYLLQIACILSYFTIPSCLLTFSFDYSPSTRLSLLSSSRVYGSGFLQHAGDTIASHFTNFSEALFTHGLRLL